MDSLRFTKGLNTYNHVIFQILVFNKSAKMSTILCFSVKMGVCTLMWKEIYLNDFSKWLQHNSETFKGV